MINLYGNGLIVKNDMKTGDFTNSAVSITTSFIATKSSNELIQFGAAAGQVLYDNGYFQNSGGTPEYLKPTVQGKNDKKYLEMHRSLGNYGY